MLFAGLRPSLLLASTTAALITSGGASAICPPKTQNCVRLPEFLARNYASTLRDPLRNYKMVPKLIHAWTHFPIRVAVVNDGRFYNEEAFKAIQGACQKWVVATKDCPHGGLTFVYDHSGKADGADIVFKLCPFGDLGTFQGLTWANSERPDEVQTIRLRMFDRSGNWTPAWRLQRVATHEVGHALGIGGHSPNTQDVMSLEEGQSEVTKADVNTLLFAYGGSFHGGTPPGGR